jgi:ketosteroid isomerase-like protein
MSESADLVRAFYAAAAEGDPAAMDVFAPDVEFRMPDVLPHGGTIRGREALAGYFGEVRGRWEDFRADLDDLVDGGDRVVALGRFCGRPRASGRDVEVPFALVWTLRDGHAVRVDEYTDTALLLDALRPAGSSGAEA